MNGELVTEVGTGVSPCGIFEYPCISLQGVLPRVATVVQAWEFIMAEDQCHVLLLANAFFTEWKGTGFFHHHTSWRLLHALKCNWACDKGCPKWVERPLPRFLPCGDHSCHICTLPSQKSPLHLYSKVRTTKLYPSNVQKPFWDVHSFVPLTARG